MARQKRRKAKTVRKPVKKAARKKQPTKRKKPKLLTLEGSLPAILNALGEIQMQVAITAEDVQEIKDRLPPYKPENEEAPESIPDPAPGESTPAAETGADPFS